MIAFAFKIDVTALGDSQCVTERFRHLAEENSHFFRTAQKVAVARHVHTIGIGEQLSSLHAEQDVLQFSIFAADVMYIVGGDQVAALTPGEIDHLAVDFGHQRIVMLLQFEEKVVSAKGLQVPISRPISLLQVIFLQSARNFPGKAGGRSDQAFVMRSQKVAVYPGVIIEALKLAGGGNLQQVLIASHVFSQQHQMVSVLVFDGVLILHGARGKVGFKADDGLDAFLFGRFEKIQSTKHGAMISECQGRHAQLLGAFYKIGWRAEAIEDGIH